VLLVYDVHAAGLQVQLQWSELAEELVRLMEPVQELAGLGLAGLPERLAGTLAEPQSVPLA
jgi:hypothetical protein